MTVLSTLIDSESVSFQSNTIHNTLLAEELRQRLASAGQGGPEALRQRHVARGKLLPRDRVMRLLDPWSPLLEVGALAANGNYRCPRQSRRQCGDKGFGGGNSVRSG